MPEHELINPFTVDLPDAWKNEISYQKAIAFVTMRQALQTLNNIQKKQIDENDYSVRDVIFHNRLPNENIPSYFDYLQQHYKPRRSINPSFSMRKVREECQHKKFEFWRKCVNLTIETKEKLETRALVQEVRNEKLFYSEIGFIGGSCCLAYLFRLHRNPVKFTLLTLALGSSLGYLHGIYNYSNRIFDELPRLPHPELEEERQHIVNYCFSLDQDLVNKYVQFDLNNNLQLSKVKD